MIWGLGITGASFGIETTRVVKEGMVLPGFWFALCAKGAGAV